MTIPNPPLTYPKSPDLVCTGVTHENSEIESHASARDAGKLPEGMCEAASYQEIQTDQSSPQPPLSGALAPAVVAGPALRGPLLGFIEFLSDHGCQEYCRLALGKEDTAAGMMLLELQKGTEFHYFGLRAGKLNEQKSATKRALREFARRAYRGDSQRRGLSFWTAVSALLWETYATVMALRHRAERITEKDVKRIDGLASKRAKRAEYMRALRAKKRAQAKRSGNTSNDS